MNDNIINYLYGCQEIKDFCKKYKLSKEVVLSNFAQFSSYKDSVEACKKCDGKKCLSKTKNTKIELEYKNGKVISNLYNCPIIASVNPNNFEVLNYTQKDIELEMTTPRYNLLTFLNKFMDDYFSNKNPKGIYLWGPCGSGKSFLLYKFSQTLVGKGAKVLFAYYPDLVRELQSSFGTTYQEELILRLKQTDIVVIDDIGREANTQYIRDEVLGPILQYRVDNNLPMFMSSNRNFEMIEKHLSETNTTIDVVKARALVERLKFLMKEYELNDKDFRNN